MTRPVAVAVTGGIGAGKSEALEAFERHGAAVVSTDDIVHRLIAEDAEVRAALERRLGTTERGRIAKIVFADPRELSWLEHLLHPLVREECERWLEGLGDLVEVAVVEIPLLYETGGEKRFDAVVVITAPQELRAARAKVPLEGRAGRLIPDDEKMRCADFAYVNEGTLEELDDFVADVLEELRRAL